MWTAKLYLSDPGTYSGLAFISDKFAQVVHVILPSSALLASVLCFVPSFAGTVDHVMCLWRHRQAVCCVLWPHRHDTNTMWSTVPALGSAKHNTLIISADEAQITRTVWENISPRRPRFLQAVKLGRYISFIHDDMHFDWVCWLFVELSAKTDTLETANWL